MISLKARLTILIADSIDSEHFNKVVFDTSIDLCRVQMLLKTSLFIKTAMLNIFTCMDKKRLACPFKKVMNFRYFNE